MTSLMVYFFRILGVIARGGIIDINPFDFHASVVNMTER